MDIFDIIQVLVFFLILFPLAYYLGKYMYIVYCSDKGIWRKPFLFAEHGLYRLCRINDKVDMTWKDYLISLLVFNLLGLVFLYTLLLLQSFLPYGNHYPPIDPILALNIAISFTTNTNWQSYAGEVTLSPLIQTLGLTVQNFLSAGTGMAVLLALVRGFTNRSSEHIGNFWQDLVRSVIYILLPLSIIVSLILVSQGVIQNLSIGHHITTLSGEEQFIPGGMVATQTAIKQLGSNGGGFFGANSMHPLENPTPLSNLTSTLSIMLIPVAMIFLFGNMIRNRKQSRLLVYSMTFLCVVGLCMMFYGENMNGINYEGKEYRIGIGNSLLWSNLTTCTSNGSTNGVVDSMSPLTICFSMLNMMLGEIIFGGVGTGLCSLILFMILTVFIAGLMVGRTPELLGKKIESKEIAMTITAILLPSIAILLFSAITVALPESITQSVNTGPHRFSEILYAFTSATANNGSGLSGLNANTPYYNITLGLCMLIGRFGVITPMLVIAGNLSQKKITPYSSGTLRTDTFLFGGLLIGIILILGALTFFPALALGPILEQLLINNGIYF